MITKQNPCSTHFHDEEKDETTALQALLLNLNVTPTPLATDSGGEYEDEDENSPSADELFSHLASIKAGTALTSTSMAAADSVASLPTAPPTTGQPVVIKQPCNSYMLYRREVLENKRAIYKSQNFSSAKISTEIGEMWRREPEEVKLIYETKADLERLAFIRAFPDFKYRKSKKASKAKAQKMQQTAPAPASATVPDSASDPPTDK